MNKIWAMITSTPSQQLIILQTVTENKGSCREISPPHSSLPDREIERKARTLLSGSGMFRALDFTIKPEQFSQNYHWQFFAIILHRFCSFFFWHPNQLWKMLRAETSTTRLPSLWICRWTRCAIPPCCVKPCATFCSEALPCLCGAVALYMSKCTSVWTEHKEAFACKL